MFLGDGLLQNLVEWTGNSIPSLGDVTFTDGGTPVVYYNQLDERYASQPYGTDNIGGYGCGPTAMANRGFLPHGRYGGPGGNGKVVI